MNQSGSTQRSRHAVEVVPDAASVATRGAEWLIEQIAHAVLRRGRAAVALSGGSTPRALYAHLAEHPWRDRVEWAKLHLFFGDERFVPHDDPASNARMADETLISHVPIRPGNVHRIPCIGAPRADAPVTAAATRSAEQAAADYQQTLSAFYGSVALDAARPLFDVVLLGLGEDGHTASLFPGASALEEREAWSVAVATQNAIAPLRVTLTYPVLESTHAVAFLVSGAAKRAIAARVLAGDESLPAARVRPQGGTLWIMDEDAGG